MWRSLQKELFCCSTLGTVKKVNYLPLLLLHLASAAGASDYKIRAGTLARLWFLIHFQQNNTQFKIIGFYFHYLLLNKHLIKKIWCYSAYILRPTYLQLLLALFTNYHYIFYIEISYTYHIIPRSFIFYRRIPWVTTRVWVIYWGVWWSVGF